MQIRRLSFMHWVLVVLFGVFTTVKASATCGDSFIASIAPTIGYYYYPAIKQKIGPRGLTTAKLKWDDTESSSVQVNLYLYGMCRKQYINEVLSSINIRVTFFNSGLPYPLGYPAAGVYPDPNQTFIKILNITDPMIKHMTTRLSPTPELFDAMSSYPEITKAWDDWVAKYRNSTDPRIKKFIKENFNNASGSINSGGPIKGFRGNYQGGGSARFIIEPPTDLPASAFGLQGGGFGGGGMSTGGGSGTFSISP